MLKGSVLFAIMALMPLLSQKLYAQSPVTVAEESSVEKPGEKDGEGIPVDEDAWLKASFVKAGYKINDDTFTEQDKIRLKDELIQKLGEQWLKDMQRGKYYVHIIGYACDEQPGDKTQMRKHITNTAIGGQRALQVKDALVALGVPREFLMTFEDRALPGQKGASYRRVEVTVIERQTAGGGVIAFNTAGLVTKEEANDPKTGFVTRASLDADDEGYVKKKSFNSTFSLFNARITRLENAKAAENRPFVRELSLGLGYHHAFSSLQYNGLEAVLGLDLRLTERWSLQPFIGIGSGSIDEAAFGNGETYTIGLRGVVSWKSGWRLYAPGILFRAFDPDRLVLQDSAAREFFGTAGAGFCWSFVCAEMNLGLGASMNALEHDPKFAFGIMPSLRFFYSFQNRKGGE